MWSSLGIEITRAITHKFIVESSRWFRIS